MNLSQIQNYDSLTDEEVNSILHSMREEFQTSGSEENTNSPRRKADAYHYLGLRALEKENFEEAAKLRDIIRDAEAQHRRKMKPLNNAKQKNK